MGRVNNSDEIKIRVSGLSDGLHEYHFSSAPSEIGLESNFTKLVEVDVIVDKISRQVHIKSDIRTTGVFSCDRCVEDFERPVAAECRMFYVYNEPDSRNYPQDEVRVIGPEAAFIDLSDDVRQMILLSIPLKLLCKEDCRGLCRQCGANRNVAACACKDDTIDARWHGLEGLIIH